MNFLAHLHIADHCDSSKLGNLLGDFVKGDPNKQYQPSIAHGVMLHRFVDSYTDQHPLMSDAKSLFDGSARRFAPIALDVFWDHCLASRWEEFHSESLRQFCHKAEQQTRREHVTNLPQRFLIVSQNMWQGRWLESYRDMDNIEFALRRMSGRSPRMGPLSDCFAYLDRHYHTLQPIFSELYPDVLNAAKSQAF
ncbi:ACP phosphodiesterase [Vibrio proteolyticus]|uniref:Acyl carrier protein phosphodiesterase n=1 Tax=Vibrio proteolyticus NBRC 13287 TaxID=1219065 RepID=U3BJ88_VIBPR|nr:ACP phosphodiesterase [Vibrio proteolyticus]GAD66713.1 acyl carrier protein phosphodiesterase [Vibrio proteolyticus NBRC 13287]